MRRFVQLVDGTRNVDRLVADFTASAAKMPGQSANIITREKVLQSADSWQNWRLLIR